MNSDELIRHADRLASQMLNCSNDLGSIMAQHAQACEFLKRFGGPDNSFLKSISKLHLTGGGIVMMHFKTITAKTLSAFGEFVRAGLAEEISPTRKAQLDVVTDLLDQANSLLENEKVHPAAPAVLIGATLEEFLRTWIEALGLSWGQRKPGIDTYVQVLRDADHIAKQDAKDITSWAGIRNHAAHGEWTHVESREKISLMLQGVNLFMRKYERGKAL